MDKNNLKDFTSVKNFKNKTEETRTLIYALQVQIQSTKQLIDFLKLKETPEYQKFKKHLEINDNQIYQLYELGFISLFSNFECFMFEFLKELFKKYPGSFKSDKLAKFEDIEYFTSVDEIKDYFFDAAAIQKSYDFEIWIDFLKNNQKINIFEDKNELKRFKAFNAVRNIIMHSGGKTNSKFRNEMRNFISTPVPIGHKHNLDIQKHFETLFSIFNTEIIQKIENI